MPMVAERYDRAERAVHAYSADLVRFAYSILMNHADAQDAVQEVFLIYMKKAPDFESTSNEKAWLLTVTANKCRSFLRSGWFKSRQPIPEDLPAEETDRALIQALAGLPPKYRTVIHLHYYEGYSVREIAQMTGSRDGTIMSRLQRGREQLKTLLGGEMDE